MLKAQLARALQLPMDTRADQGLDLLRALDASEAEGAEGADGANDAGEPGKIAKGSSPDLHAAADRDCDRVIATLRARLAGR